MIKFVLYTPIPTQTHVWVPFFCRLNCILSFRDSNFFERVHLEWTYSKVPSRVCYSSGVGLRLLVRLEKSLITKGPHRYV